MICCPKCYKELVFYPDIVGDKEMDNGVFICENNKCENEGKEVFNSGDFE